MNKTNCSSFIVHRKQIIKRFKEERKERKRIRKYYMCVQILDGIIIYVFFEDSKDLAYIFIYINEDSRGVCQSTSVELWVEWFGCQTKI